MAVSSRDAAPALWSKQPTSDLFGWVSPNLSDHVCLDKSPTPKKEKKYKLLLWGLLSAGQAPGQTLGHTWPEGQDCSAAAGIQVHTLFLPWPHWRVPCPDEALQPLALSPEQ